ncbi:hypothetical protein TSAR_003600 [Trichomalopsis sarcophagae]|uniref:Reverse transcriptase domain-containing protein n=1 Tax=Trichomalopsis sarcophagae TaxID=543379 RepID=A0A232EVZ1_9HYME|nr:hypothetical protein TSAR_003600 [Trichomalopsis sarcophagae]
MAITLEKKENNIIEEDWIKHFKELLQGTEEHQLEIKRKKEEELTEEEKITGLEIKGAWKMLKKKKAAGVDEIPNEVWIHGGEDLKNILGKEENGNNTVRKNKNGIKN